MRRSLRNQWWSATQTWTYLAGGGEGGGPVLPPQNEEGLSRVRVRVHACVCGGALGVRGRELKVIWETKEQPSPQRERDLEVEMGQGCG